MYFDTLSTHWILIRNNFASSVILYCRLNICLTLYFITLFMCVIIVLIFQLKEIKVIETPLPRHGLRKSHILRSLTCVPYLVEGHCSRYVGSCKWQDCYKGCEG